MGDGDVIEWIPVGIVLGGYAGRAAAVLALYRPEVDPGEWPAVRLYCWEVLTVSVGWMVYMISQLVGALT